ncbi:rhomboid family intramembrane serine protease [Trichlorobacter lovleyi]|uniref:rhomboid family intramembrane serine protease n=1 Tax=Trichlorobacter lovleyi TaxID=313985 RepID=UPI003D10018D
MDLDSLHTHFDTWAEAHPEQLFIAKSVALMLLVFSGQKLLSSFVFLWFFSGGFISYLLLSSATNGHGIRKTLKENLSIWWMPHADDADRKRDTPWVTFGLIGLNSFCYLLTSDDLKVVAQNLIWLPMDPDIINVPFSLFTSLFLHADSGHLTGNMFFLWVFGSAMERRIPRLRFAQYYLLAGIVGNLIALVMYGLFAGEALHSLGASGAISGLMGMYLVRCYYRQMVFPLPLLGILPINMKIRMNAFALIGFYFALDLQGGVAQMLGVSGSSTGHWAHIGGLLTGIIIAYCKGMQHEGVEERHLELGLGLLRGKSIVSAGSDAAGGFGGAEKSLLTVLQKNPENHLAWLQLARIKSFNYPTEQGWNHYRRALLLIAKQAPAELPEVYRECYGIYRQPHDLELEMRAAVLLYRHGDLDMASRSLEHLLESKRLTAEQQEKAQFQYAKTLEEMGLTEAAYEQWYLFLQQFPNSAFGDNARMRFERLPKPQTVGDILKQAREYEVHEYRYGLAPERE